MKPLEDFASAMFEVPGEWLLQQFIGASFEDELRSALTITLGFVMWLGALLAVLIVVRRVRSWARRPAVAVARTSPGIPRAGGMLATLQRQARAGRGAMRGARCGAPRRCISCSTLWCRWRGKSVAGRC